MDETYIKVRGEWMYLYRAIDSLGDTVEFLFRESRDLPAAKLHLQRARQLRPESSQAQYKLALIAIQEGHLEVALKELQIVIRDSPDWLEAHVELAGLYYRLHRPEDGARERLLVDRLATPQPPGR